MKPKNIFLIRHSESQGNVDKTLYKTVPDWKINITDKGKQQAKEASKHLIPYIPNSDPKPFLITPFQFYISPWHRTRQTAEIIIEELKKQNIKIITKEDPRLREQEFGNYQKESTLEMEKDRKSFSRFYYRVPMGESACDVFDRISTFLETMHRDFKKPNFPENVVIVTHGVTLLIFLMRFLHWSPEFFDSLKTPKNGEMFTLSMNKKGKYILKNKMKLRN